MNRRKFIKRISSISMLGYSSMLSGGAPAYPKNLRLRQNGTPPSSGEKAVLTQDDITYLGMFRTPDDPNDQNGQPIRLGYSAANITGRYVSGQLRILMTGSVAPDYPQPIYEFNYPGYNTSFASAPVATLIYNWGDVYKGKRINYRNASSATRGIFWWNNYLWWAYGDYYNASSSSWDPSIGASSLVAGNVQAYGPWRTYVHSQQTRGYILKIPTWWRDLYASGRSLAVGAPITSGNGASPWGPSLHALRDIDPPNLAADPVQSGTQYTGNEQKSANTLTCLLNDISHKAARDTQYYACGWNVLYDCNQGSWLNAGTPEFTSLDTMHASVWIDLPTKHGVILFGQLVGPAPSAQLPHFWYGITTCCHSRVATNSEGTGDHSDSVVPYWFIYDPADLAQVAQGQKNAYAVTPTSTINQYALHNHVVSDFFYGGAWFDETTNLLFLASSMEDSVTNSYEPRPIIRVFSVA